MIRRALILTVLAVSPSASLPAPAAGETGSTNLVPVGLQAAAEGWSPNDRFTLTWSRATGTPAPTAIAYRVRDATGVLRRAEIVLTWWSDQVSVRVPPTPGLYTVELRLAASATAGLLEDLDWGPWVGTTVRFDDTRPSPAQPAGPGGWIGAGAAPRLRIGRPLTLPPSGVRGYAVAIGPRAGEHPCAAAPLCDSADLDLSGGVDDDELVLPKLTEGVHFANVVAVSGAGLSSAAVGVAELLVDNTVPEVVLTGGGEGWMRGPARLRARASDRLSGMAPDGPAGPFTAIAVDGGLPRIAAGAEVETVVTGDGFHRIDYYGRDAAGNVGDGQLRAPPPRTARVWIDGSPPVVSFSRAGEAGDLELIEAVVTDRLSGPAPDRGWIGVRAVGGTGAFTPLPTRIEQGRLRARWDSDSHPPGNYELRATGFDRVGNRGTTGSRADGARLVLPSPLKEPVALRLGFGGRRLVWHRCSRHAGRRRCKRETIAALDRRPASRRMPYGRRVPVTGRLVDSAGAPLAGRRVTLVEALASGRARTGETRTRGDGTFFSRLAPGPSRQVELRFGGDRVRSRATSRRLLLLVSAAVRMRGSAATATVGGAPVRFRGRVGSRGARVPDAGLQVELQFRLPGGAWTEFRTVRTDRHGRFRYAYAFSDDDSRGARFLFRAHVPDQAGWPYAAGSSRPIAITGR